MKVNELRTALDKYEKAALKEIVVLLYKKIPKNRKEDEGLDELLLNYSKENERAKKAEAPVDFSKLADEIMGFFSLADAQMYFAPNKIVNKTKRSKWRLEVKRFIKDLSSVTGESSVAAARVLAYVYEMLSYACNYYIFNTQSPFTAVGYKQRDLLYLVLYKIFYNGYDDRAMKTAVYVTLDSNVDRDSLHSWLMNVLLGFLKTPDTLEMAIRHCVAFRLEYDAYQGGKKIFRYRKNDTFRKEEKINESAELYLMLKIKLAEYDDGIGYFWQYYKNYRPEVTLYVLLLILAAHDLNDLWIREYEKAVKKKIEPRKSLQAEYEKRKTGWIPENDVIDVDGDEEDD